MCFDPADNMYLVDNEDSQIVYLDPWPAAIHHSTSTLEEGYSDQTQFSRGLSCSSGGPHSTSLPLLLLYCPVTVA